MHDILVYLQDKSLADLSFRTLADGLGISSFVLVYHFGSREELITEIVHALEERPPMGVVEPDLATSTPRELAAWLLKAWETSSVSYYTQLRRLGIESTMQDLVLEHPRGHAPQKYEDWISLFTQWFQNQGKAETEAKTLARMLSATINGIHYDYILTGDREETDHVFRRMIELFLQSNDEPQDSELTPSVSA